MFDHKIIKEEFVKLVGLPQNDNPAFPVLSPSLVYNGDNVQIQHALINIENIDLCARNYAKYQFPVYNPLTPYAVGARIRYGAVNYQAILASTGQQPDISPLSWAVLNLLDLFLQDVFSNAAEDTVNEVLNKKKIAGQAKTLLSSTRFFEGNGTFTDLIINEGDLVGVQIQLLYANNMSSILEQVGIQLTSLNPTLTFYLYHSSQYEPLQTIQVNHTKVSSFQWHDLNLKLNYLSKLYDSGGRFYLMYDQDQLVGQAIKKVHNFDHAPCGYCSDYNTRAYNNYSKYISVRSVRVKAVNRDGINLWDTTKTQYTPDTNWGLNLQASVRCDITDFLVQQKDVFQYAMRDMVTKKLLEIMANTTRQNVGQAKLDVLARNELMATYAGGMGFMKQLEDQLKAVDFEFSELDDLCLPCNRKNGLRYGTASLSGGR